MIYQRQIAKLNHLRNLKNLLISIPIGMTICIFLFLIDQDDIVFYVVGIGYFIYMIPVILIHANYYSNDRKKIVTIGGLNKSMEIINKDKMIVVFLHDVHCITFTTGLEGRASSIWSDYYYYQIRLKNGDFIFLTSLLIKKNDFPFDIDLKRNIAFPFVKYTESEK